MINKFYIIDGIVYVDKHIFRESLQIDNNISKLSGSTCLNIFKTKPKIITGVESVTIDFHNIDGIAIHKDPLVFVDELRKTYQNKVRGHLVIDMGNESPVDIHINSY